MRYLSCAVCLIALGLLMPAQGRAGMHAAEAGARKGIHEAMFVSLNGVEQWITIRGDDVRNPVVLMLHGGPGFATSELAPAFAGFERDYTLAQWDQPGGGATYAKNMGKNIGALTIARYRRDGIALAELLEHRLHARKVLLYGTSWGTVLALEKGVRPMGVPAGDFGRDARIHGRMAVMRAVEDAFALVRAASNGLVTVSEVELASHGAPSLELTAGLYSQSTHVTYSTDLRCSGSEPRDRRSSRLVLLTTAALSCSDPL